MKKTILLFIGLLSLVQLCVGQGSWWNLVNNKLVPISSNWKLPDTLLTGTKFSLAGGSSSIATVGALSSGSITTGFTSIDTAFLNGIGRIVSKNTFLIMELAGKTAFLNTDTTKYATASMTGFLSFTDWVRFNAMATGAVTSVTASSGLQSSGGATPAITPATGYNIPETAALSTSGITLRRGNDHLRSYWDANKTAETFIDSVGNIRSIHVYPRGGVDNSLAVDAALQTCGQVSSMKRILMKAGNWQCFTTMHIPQYTTLEIESGSTITVAHGYTGTLFERNGQSANLIGNGCYIIESGTPHADWIAISTLGTSQSYPSEYSVVSGFRILYAGVGLNIAATINVTTGFTNGDNYRDIFMLGCKSGIRTRKGVGCGMTDNHFWGVTNQYVAGYTEFGIDSLCSSNFSFDGCTMFDFVPPAKTAVLTTGSRGNWFNNCNLGQPTTNYIDLGTGNDIRGYDAMTDGSKFFGPTKFDTVEVQNQVIDSARVVTWNKSAPSEQAYWTAGNYYSNTIGNVAPTTATLGVGVIRAWALKIDYPTKIGTFNFEVAAWDSGVVHMGIWDDSLSYNPTTGNAHPANLIADWGEDTLSAEVKTLDISGSPITLQPGLYWVGYTCRNVIPAIAGSTMVATIRAVPLSASPNVLGFTNTMGTSTPYIIYQATVSPYVSTLPSPFPTATKYNTSSGSPEIFWQKVN